nr:DUF3626 domain-containing protein [Mobilicoccus sp.]
MDRSLRITVNFHPDRTAGEGRADGNVLEALADGGVYRSQLETGTGIGGLTAHPGGDRWLWERALFDGAYDDAPPTERPRYGALNHRRWPLGCVSGVPVGVQGGGALELGAGFAVGEPTGGVKGGGDPQVGRLAQQCEDVLDRPGSEAGDLPDLVIMCRTMCSSAPSPTANGSSCLEASCCWVVTSETPGP